MTNLMNLVPGGRVRWVRLDPRYGVYGVPVGPKSQSCVVTGYGDDRRDGKVSYRCRIEGLGSWYLLSSMIDLEEGPW